ncbi:CDP-glycerol glycerophosphotransferase family protein [uncultured Mailhella sp.]|uniref:CDP-glycerol glycerophosphotransferase family protein n=1 Tax=uncultured Mailhella sp. TaxID=1981031 RepID=UPI002628DA90|nr:CDP-glycerol glycerophosphotransferase family protein [uncultured Mailhella sp.]
MTARYIGKGDKAFAVLNMLEADVCIMTTPGLDVLQIKRSRGVRHYAHIVHAAGSGILYRLFGLDHYDSFFSPGPQQEGPIRKLEKLRGIKPKQILHSGCPYFDVFMEQKRNLGKEQHGEREDGIRILVAPTWGSSGLLSRYGQSLLKPLAEAGYQVVVRPHPQSRMVESELLESLEHELSAWPNLVWDKSSNGFEAMSSADILISDYSSIIFDFAYVMERPVLTMDFTPDLSPYDAYDLGETPWALQAHKRLGRKLTLDDIPNIAEIVEELHNDKELKEQILIERDNNVYNFGKAGPVIADQLIAIRNSLKEKNKGNNHA